MPIAVGSQTRLSLVREAVFNTVPNNPAFQQVRETDLSFSFKPKYVQSKEVRSDGMAAGQIYVGKEVSSKYGIELSPDSHDDIIEAALRKALSKTPEVVKAVAEIASVAISGVYNVAAGLGTPFKVGHLVKASGFTNAANNGISRCSASTANSVTIGLATVAEAVPPVGARIKVIGIRAAAAGSITAVAGATNKLTIATTEPSALGLAVGSWFKAAGFTGTVANNGWYRVASISGAGPWDIVCDIVPQGFASDAAAGQTVDLYFSDYGRPGTTRFSYAAEEAHLDLATFKYFTGLVVNKLILQLRSDSLISGSAEFVGMDGAWGAQKAGATYAAPKTTTPFNTSSNLGGCYINGAWVTGVVTSADININSNALGRDALGAQGNADIQLGAFSVDGSLERYFVDTTLQALMMAGTPTNIVLIAYDSTQQSAYLFDIRRAKLPEGEPTVQNADDALSEPYKWVAEVDPTVGYMIHVQKFESVS